MAKKELSERDLLFLELLFTECEGNPRQALLKAGFSEGYPTSALVKRLEDEILERTKLYLAQNAPKAAISIAGLMDNPVQLGGGLKLSAAKDVLDRIGISKTEKVEVNPGVFILPPKSEE